MARIEAQPKMPRPLVKLVMKFLMFTKMLKNTGNLTLEEAGDEIARIGFDGADLTVRPSGYVLPEEATARLTEAIATLESKGLSVPMVTTNITDAKEGHAEEIFSAASRCEVRYVKLGYWGYEGFGKAASQIKRAREQLTGIKRLSKKYGVTAALHNHAGPYVTADPWVMLTLLQEYDPEDVCAYVDPGHLLGQCGPRGWEMGMDMLSQYIRLVAVKNYWYLRQTGETAGEKRWKTEMLPLREEVVPWPTVFRNLKTIGFDGNISVHSEYEHLCYDELIRQTTEDLLYLKRVVKGISS